MKISALLTPERVICMDQINSKKRALEAMAQLLAKGTGEMDPADIFNRLIERERLGSTGLGHGVAIPHARLGAEAQTIGAFIKLDQGIDFDSPDHIPTDIMFGLLVPEAHTDEHLRILADLAALLSDTSFTEELRATQNSEELFERLLSWSTSDNAT